MAEHDLFKVPLKPHDEDGNEIWTQGSSQEASDMSNAYHFSQAPPLEMIIEDQATQEESLVEEECAYPLGRKKRVRVLVDTRDGHAKFNLYTDQEMGIGPDQTIFHSHIVDSVSSLT